MRPDPWAWRETPESEECPKCGQGALDDDTDYDDIDPACDDAWHRAQG